MKKCYSKTCNRLKILMKRSQNGFLSGGECGTDPSRSLAKANNGEVDISSKDCGHGSAVGVNGACSSAGVKLGIISSDAGDTDGGR